MELASYWYCQSTGWRRVRRSSSFLPPVGLIPPTANSRSACPLPKKFAPTAKLATIGYGDVHSWGDHHARYLLNSRGQRLFVQSWKPWDSQPRGRVLIVHGLGDHSNKYTHVARKFVNAGYAVVAADAHGHGRSDGLRAYAARFDDYVEDAATVLNEATKRDKRLPTYVVGHSLGGAVAIHLARDYTPQDLKGVLLTAPAVRVFSNPVLRFFAPIIANIVPLLPVQKLDFGAKRNRRVNKTLLAMAPGFGNSTNNSTRNDNDDPLLVRGSVRARTGIEVLKSCERIMSRANGFRIPVFIAHSHNDRVTKAAGSEEFCKKIGSRDKTFRKYHGMGHDLLASSHDNQVVDDMVKWIRQRSP